MSAGQAVLITGGARRIGAALARHFARAGYGIALHYHRSEAEARELQREIAALGVQCALFRQDLSDIPALAPLMESVRSAMPRCVALINNASIFERAGFMETDEALFDRQLTVNFKAPFFLTQAFARVFGKGCVINVLDTDIAQTHTSHFAYLLSKKALADFTTMAARALGPEIRVSGVCPGCLLPSGQNDAAYERKMKNIVPLKSHPKVEELAETTHWLITQQHVTGQLLYVDGGQHVL